MLLYGSDLLLIFLEANISIENLISVLDELLHPITNAFFKIALWDLQLMHDNLAGWYSSVMIETRAMASEAREQSHWCFKQQLKI